MVPWCLRDMMQKRINLEAENNPKVIWRKENCVMINWDNVFPVCDEHCFYELRLKSPLGEWKVVYWGKKLESIVCNLEPCAVYDLKIRLLYRNAQSHWLDFKAATSADQFYVKHLERALKLSKIPAIRKIITSRPFLLEAVNAESKTPLMQATEMGDLHLVKHLHNLGANLNSQCTAARRSPLMLALFYGHKEIAQYLVDKGANINLRDVNERTALHYAIDANNYDAVLFALDNGALINAGDNKGWSPLLRAVILEASDEIVILLLDRGCDRTAVDNRGRDFKQHLELTRRISLSKLYA